MKYEVVEVTQQSSIFDLPEGFIIIDCKHSFTTLKGEPAEHWTLTYLKPVKT